MTPDQYEEKLAQETLYLLRLNMALDLLAPVLGIQVGNHEITEYLSSPNPQKFLEEIREKGQVEAARQAAVRVKTMRRVIDTAYVNGVIEGSASAHAGSKGSLGECPDEVPAPGPLPAPVIRNAHQCSASGSAGEDE